MTESEVTKKRVITYVTLFVALFFGYFLLRSFSWQGSKQLHTIMEVTATVLAWTVGVLALIHFYTKKNNTFLFIGTAFLGTSVLDGYHAAVTSSFFDMYFPSAPSSLIPWSWIASRVFLSVFLYLSFLAWKREETLGEAGRVKEQAVYWLVAIATLASFAFFAFIPLPKTYFFGESNVIWHLHRPEEFLPAIFFFLALTGYFKKGGWKSDHFEHWLMMSIIIGFMSQVMFVSTSEYLFDIQFDAAHLLKKFSYLSVLIGLLISMFHIFRQAVNTADELALSSVELQEINERLEIADEIARAVGSSLREKELFPTIAHEIRQATPYDRLFIGSINFETGEIFYWHTESNIEVPPVSKGDVSWMPWYRDLYENNTPLIHRDLREVSYLRAQDLAKAGFRSQLVVPIVRDGQCVAHLALSSTRVDAFSGNHREQLIALSSHINVALQNSTLFRQAEESVHDLEIMADELREANDRLAVLAQATENISKNLDMENLLRTVSEEAKRIFGNHRISVILRDSNEWKILFSEGLSESYQNALMHNWERIPAHSVMADQLPIFIENALTDPTTQAIHETIEREGFSSMSILPLREARKTFAILTLYFDFPRRYGEEYQALARTFSEHVSISLQNALSLDRARHEAEKLQTLDELNRQISQSLDMNEVLQNITLSAVGLLSGIFSRLYLYDENSGLLELKAQYGKLTSFPNSDSFPPDSGFRGIVYQQSKPILVQDVLKDDRFREKKWAEERNLHGFIAVPILQDGKAIGILNCMSKEAGGFSNDDISLLQSLANLGTIAIQNASLYKDSEEKGKRLSTLVEIAQRLTRGLDLTEVLNSIAESAADLFDGEAGFRLLEGKELIRVAATPGAIGAMKSESIRLGESLSGKVAETGEPAQSSNYSKDHRVIPAHREGSREDRSGSVMCVPVMLESHILGTLNIFKKQGHEFSQDEIDLATSLADQAAVAFQNAKLFEEIRTHAHRLQLSEARFRSLFDSAQDAVIAIDERGFVTLFNNAAEKMFEYTSDEIVGRKVNLLMPSPHSEDHDGHLERYHKTGEQKAIGHVRTLDARRKSGEVFPIELSIGEVAVGDNQFFIGILRDITERHEIDRMKSEFISVVSHEIRTPLTSLRGSLGLLAGGIAGTFSEQGEELMKIAVNNTERLIRLINDILDLEKIESGNMELQISPCALEEIADRAIDEMQGLASESGISIHKEIEGCLVSADGDSVVQVLTNLISNAVKFSEPGSRITVGADCMDGEAKIWVADSGRGIPPEAIDSIFDRFKQVDSSDQRDKGGTGLGLAICSAIVIQHGGRIWVESEPGAGSTFYFTLPRALPEAAVPAALKRDGKIPVLVCDDDRDFIRLMQILMEEQGYSIIPTFSAEEALEYLKKNKVAAVVLDIHLPGMSGLELLAEIRSLPEGDHPPVIVVSGDERADLPDMPTPVVLDWITKPLDEVRLLKSLKAAIKLGQAATALVVDDDPDLCEIVSRLLKNRGIQVETASSGIAAVEKYRKTPPDLLVLDIVMPDGDGFHVIEALRNELETNKTPIIVYSAQEPTSEEKQRLATETTLFLTKLKTPQDEFMDHVVDLLNGLLTHSPGLTEGKPANER